MSEKPKVSIIVPVYRVEKYLKTCVDTLLAQTYANLEIFLVDDCSDDGCSCICDEYAARNPLVKALHLKENRGLSGARNAAMPLATGEWIAFVDSDDTVSPSYISDFMDASQKIPDAGIIQCDFLPVREDAGSVDFCPSIPSRTPEYFTNEAVVDALYGKNLHAGINFTVWNKIFRRDAIGNILFEPKMLCEDVIFSSKVILNGASLVVIHQQNYFYRQRESSIMGELRADKDRLILRHCLAYRCVLQYSFSHNCTATLLIAARLGQWYASGIKTGLMFRDRGLKKCFKEDCRKYQIYRNRLIPTIKRFLFFIVCWA